MAEEKEVVLTPEQQAAQDVYDAGYVRGSLVSIRWMRARLEDGGPVLKVCTENAAAIGNYVKTHNLPWTEESLDEAYEALKDIPGALIFEQDTPAPKVPAPSEPIAPEFPWGDRLTKKAVDNMSRDDYKKFMLSKKFGEEFKSQVSAVL
jgi:hypothetical protein